MMSSLHPKCQPKILRISALEVIEGQLILKRLVYLIVSTKKATKIL